MPGAPAPDVVINQINADTAPKEVVLMRQARDTLNLGIHEMNGTYRQARWSALDPQGIRTQPPDHATDLLLKWLLSPADYEAVLGDLEEAYRKRLSRIGRTRAGRWYRRQIFGTILCFLWDACHRWARPGRCKERL